jgi:hypothetical protein
MHTGIVTQGIVTHCSKQSHSMHTFRKKSEGTEMQIETDPFRKKCEGTKMQGISTQGIVTRC